MVKEKNEKHYWLHRITGGVNGHILSIPLLRDFNMLSIGWSFISSEKVANDIQKRGEVAIRKAYEEENADWASNTRSLLNFVYWMHEGDIVVVPMGAYLNIYRIADNTIYTNDNIPDEYTNSAHVIKKPDGIVTLDGQLIDLGFYRRVEPVIINARRSDAEKDLYRKTKAFHTNLNITDVAMSVEKLITKSQDNQVVTNTEALIIPDFEIWNYKNINNLDLTGLKRVNLFVGANNAGKSNLLEAISLYASNFSHRRMMEILEERNEDMEFFEEGRRFEEKELISAFSSFFPQRSVDRMASGESIRLSSRGDGIQLSLKTAIYRDDLDVRRLARLSPYDKVTQNQKVSNLRESVLVTQPIEIDGSVSQTQTKYFENVIQMIRISNRGIEFPPNSIEKKLSYRYLNCKYLRSRNVEEMWAKISMTDMENVVLDALRLVDNRVLKFNYVKVNTHTYAPMVLLEGHENKMPLSEMGDGMTHILNIIITILSCHNGIILLDEVESGLHYSTQTKLWEMIYTLAQKYNVQVFATTHSNDCIKSFAELDKENTRALLVRLANKSGKIIPVYYRDIEDVRYAISNGIEGR